MPTVQQFYASGKGNGFPFCLEKVDVSGFDNYVAWTLGQAMSVYWNLNEVVGFFNLVNAETLNNVPIFNVKIGDNIQYNSEDGTETSDNSDYINSEPNTRICVLNRAGDKYTELGAGFFDDRIAINLKSRCIVKYYNGLTDNEENFVGYGMKIDSINDPLAFAYGFDIDGFVRFKHTILTTFYRASDYVGTPTVTEVIIDDLPVLKVEIGTGQGSDITGLEFYTYT